jgi:hypothetical protein
MFPVLLPPPPIPLPLTAHPPAPCPPGAAYAGHSVLNLLFPFRWARNDRVLAALVAPLTKKQKGAGESAGRAAALAVVRARWVCAGKRGGGSTCTLCQPAPNSLGA